ncbi:SDR family NAD(P)-dependent oxidoreductase [Frigoribacterium sp. UYMn621]|uniref:SDR family oxidoreductase n=1 Tax=Frigoribacterium sp. UYMn621 TaxID=3156343 RepID=UPI003398381F
MTDSDEFIVRSERPAIVTGAARGIGAGIADALLAAGHPVVVVDINTDALAEFRAARPKLAERLAIVAADVSDEAAWETILQETQRRFGPVAVLVNNAGISPKHNGLRRETDGMPLEEWNRVIAVNLTSAFLGVRAVLPAMRAQGWGRIVNVSSQAGRQGARIAGVHYGVTKSALLGLAMTVAYEYGADGITANSVTPGRVETDMAAQAPDEVNARLAAAIPVGRVGQPADIGATISFLAGDSASFITGATIDVNGGSFMG